MTENSVLEERKIVIDSFKEDRDKKHECQHESGQKDKNERQDEKTTKEEGKSE